MSFKEFILEEEKKDYYKNLMTKVNTEYQNYECYPSYDNIFHAFDYLDFENIKVVILGQDPYHEPNQAHGLAFSVLCEKLPPSLKNIYKEMESDLNVKIDQNGNLDYLAKQGVLLLNTTLTVRRGLANSHKDFGWEIFTDNLLKEIDKYDNIVYILWGSYAIKKKNLLKNKNNYIITSAHPSPLSAYRGFFGSRPFSKANNFLASRNIKTINWVNEENSNGS